MFKAMGGTAGPSPRRARRLASIALVFTAGGCGILPGELNLSPLYRHRLDQDGSVREMDVLWPVFHYRKTEDDGWEFRARPLYRYVSEGAQSVATEHQFLWPLGRVRDADGETRSRLFPLWRYHDRDNDKGQRETDWNIALLVWGGRSEDASENYFALVPFYADIPNFLTYDRFQMHLFPLHVGLEKGDSHGHLFLWPLTGWGGNESGTKRWHRILPFYGVNIDEEQFERYTALWPFVHWGRENIAGDDPISRFFLFPLIGWQTSQQVAAWAFLWPFFQKLRVGERFYKLDLLWPIYRYQARHNETSDSKQWWLWPLVGRFESATKKAWSFLWPLIWWRSHEDYAGVEEQRQFLPFYRSTHRERADGTVEDFTKVWPLFHHSDSSGAGDWQLLSPWPWRNRQGEGYQEHYGFLWTLAAASHTPEASSLELAANLYTSSERDGRTQSSVPFLFNYESDEAGATLRLFQFIPIPLGRAEPSEEPH